MKKSLKSRISGGVTTKQFLELLRAEGLEHFYSGLPDSHRREYETWIFSGVKAETVNNRVKKALEMLREKQRLEKGLSK